MYASVGINTVALSFNVAKGHSRVAQCKGPMIGKVYGPALCSITRGGVLHF